MKGGMSVIQSAAMFETSLHTARAAFHIWLMGRSAAGDGFHFDQEGSGFHWYASNHDGRPASDGRITFTPSGNTVRVTLTTDSYSLAPLIREGLGKTRREVEDHIRTGQDGVLAWLAEFLGRDDVHLGGKSMESSRGTGLS